MDWARAVEAVDAAKQRQKEWHHDADVLRTFRGARAQAYPSRDGGARRQQKSAAGLVSAIFRLWGNS
jgi:hypothetical protein